MDIAEGVHANLLLCVFRYGNSEGVFDTRYEWNFDIKKKNSLRTHTRGHIKQNRAGPVHGCRQKHTILGTRAA